jgi:nucleoside-diphosphate-sugar epimerase
VLALAEMVVKMARSRSRIVHEPLPQDDAKVRQPDITKARSLGWAPQVELPQGLATTIESFKQKLP